MVSYRNADGVFFTAAGIRRDRDRTHSAGGLSAGAEGQHQKASEQGYVFHGIFLFSSLIYRAAFGEEWLLGRPTSSFTGYTDAKEKGLSRRSKEVVNLC
jgi:hypothetical protein